MTLKKLLNDKLLFVSKKIERADSAFHKVYKFIQNFVVSESLNNELIRVFALKKIILEDLHKKLNHLKLETKAIENHQEIISAKDYSLQKALEILEKHDNKYSDLIAELQAILVFLGHRIKE